MIAAMMALTAMSIDIMLPALPQIAASFGVADPNAQQLVVTDYLLGFAAGQLLFGPLSDRFGRRPVLFAGLGVYALGAFACVVAGSFETLLAARFAQGLAGAAARVIAVAVVRDVYGGRRMAQVMSFVMMVFIIVPILAPAGGGAILLVAPWTAIFGFLFAFALGLAGWTALRLPLAQAAASFTNSRLVMRLGMRRLSHTAMIGFTATGLTHLGLALALGGLPLPVFAGLLALNFFCFGFIMANFNALAMEPMGRIAGTASSFVGATTTTLSATLGWVVGQSFAGTVVPLLAGFAVFGAAALGLVLWTERGRLFRDPREVVVTPGR